MVLKVLFCLLSCLGLTGCVAETILGDEEAVNLDLPQEFPKLHTVPERPAPENMDLVNLNQKLADETNIWNMKMNKRWRESLGLEVEE